MTWAGPAGAPSFPLASVRALALMRQGLAGPGCRDPRHATEAAVGIYSSAPTCYLSCAARVPGFRAPHLDNELYQQRRLLRLRCMHDMAYIVSVESLPEIIAATRAGEKDIARVVRVAGLTGQEYADLARRIEGLLAERPSATVPELRALLGAHAPARRESLNYAVHGMCREYRLVRAEARGTWRSNNYAYALFASWLGTAPPVADRAQACARLARWYLAAYGPATIRDLKWWAGWTVRDTRAALSALADEVTPVTFTLPGTSPVEAIALTTDLGALAAAGPDAARGVRLLPVWDTLMMGYERASRVHRLVPERDYPRVYDGAGNGTSVVLVDGMAAGVWELDDEETLTVRVAPFGPELDSRWAEVEMAASGIAAAVGAAGLRVERCPAPGALAEGARNAYLSPVSLGATGLSREAARDGGERAQG